MPFNEAQGDQKTLQALSWYLVSNEAVHSTAEMTHLAALYAAGIIQIGVPLATEGNVFCKYSPLQKKRKISYICIYVSNKAKIELSIYFLLHDEYLSFSSNFKLCEK